MADHSPLSPSPRRPIAGDDRRSVAGEDLRSVAAVGLTEKIWEMEAFVTEIFDAVSGVKNAYVGLQEAHCPWDPHKIRAADAGVVAGIRKLVGLRDRFRRRVAGDGGAAPIPVIAGKQEEAAVEVFRREIEAKEMEIEKLKEKLRIARRDRGRSIFGGECIRSVGSTAAPTPELFESCMKQVKSAAKSFTANLLSAQPDLFPPAGSIIAGGIGEKCFPKVPPQHARHVLESLVNRHLFHGFENESFYLEGSLSSLLRPAEFRRDCFAQFLDMRAMDPTELLGILPTCQFGRFSTNKYLAVVHPKTEETLFGGAAHRRAVAAGDHPRSEFYACFLRLAKAVWLLHLLAFASDPVPTHFECSKGAKFLPENMESVVKFAGGERFPAAAAVGFSVSPGFKFANGVVVKARVYVVAVGS